MQEAQLLICATAKELPWLNCCLRSAQKFYSSAHNPIVVLTPECRSNIPSIVNVLRAYVVFMAAADHPYVRLTADCYMTSQMVMFLDVHDMFIRACDIRSFTEAGRPVVVRERYTPTLVRPDADIHCVK